MTKGPANSNQLKSLRAFNKEILETRPEFLRSTYPSDYAPLMKAAEYFGLDPAKKEDAHYLLCSLARVLFPGKGRKTGSAQWNTPRLLRLASHFREVESDNPDISDSEAARKIHERYPLEYQSAAAIRPRLPMTRKLLKIVMSRLEDEQSEEMFARETVLWLDVWMEQVDEMPSEKRRLFLQYFARPGFRKMLVQWGREEAIKMGL